MTGQTLKRHRIRLGHSQQELAAMLGVDPMTVSRWERGVHRIPVAVAHLVTGLLPRKSPVLRRRKGDR